MVITYHGGGSFRVQNGSFSLLFDPPDKRLKGDILIRTEIKESVIPTMTDEIVNAGEYEIQGIEIQGIEVFDKNSAENVKTIYRINWDGIVFANLGTITDIPNVDTLDTIGSPDILILPINEKEFLSQQQSLKIVKKIDPQVIIPSHYQSAKKLSGSLGKKTHIEEKLVFKKGTIDAISGDLFIIKA